MQLTPEELKAKMESKEDIFLLDVRTPEEYGDWHIPGSVNIPMSALATGFEGIPSGKEVVAICAHGARSKIATQFLASKGYAVKTLAGGMASWNAVYDSALIPYTVSKDFKVFQVKRIGKGCLGYIMSSREELAVIDPSHHIQEFISIANRMGKRITKVIDTHQHADHVSGARALAQETGAELFLNELDVYRFSGFTNLKDCNRLHIADIPVEVIHTPGHTKGSTSFLIEGKLLITGDILFVDGIARPDLRDRANEYAVDLFSTYNDKILSLSGSTEILPAHASSPSLNFGAAIIDCLDSIRKRLPVLGLSRSEFVEAVKNVQPKPPNYEDILRINKGEKPYDNEEADALEEGANRCVSK
jgi:glyoxylase-like metal-dependent hydrolase (beta-lactamase superfamily II)/rhodanese-related sulfurtransferase